MLLYVIYLTFNTLIWIKILNSNLYYNSYFNYFNVINHIYLNSFFLKHILKYMKFLTREYGKFKWIELSDYNP